VLDHIALHVSDYRKSKQFYAIALKPLGFELIMEFGESGGFGKDGKPDFWIAQGAATKPPLHIAFRSADRPTSTRSIVPRWPPAQETTARPGCGPTTTPATTAPSSSTRTGITSRPCATGHDRALTPCGAS